MLYWHEAAVHRRYSLCKINSACILFFWKQSCSWLLIRKSRYMDNKAAGLHVCSTCYSSYTQVLPIVLGSVSGLTQWGRSEKLIGDHRCFSNKSTTKPWCTLTYLKQLPLFWGEAKPLLLLGSFLLIQHQLACNAHKQQRSKS